ncbi:hypothetical protein [Rhizobacter sp. Root404]|uniref:hypothetical protein n=1 Tax=Rhizobacter sp. Root404 TaxID=1736528 RepID=UPI0006F6B043|nr:hypothetical protein [Rhizobacter sp. Root404]KQW36583.1 hypothetical protein ASC76_18175 [Rhizobacter sp. Root404]
MAQRNDQVFQLSLTEIAFTIAFILLLLLGYLVFSEEAKRKDAEAELAKVQTAERATKGLDAAKVALKAALQGTGVGSPDEVITKLIAVEDVSAERDRLKLRVEDLDAKLTALAELSKRLEEVQPAAQPGVMREEVTSALALQDQIRKSLDEAEDPAPSTAPGASQPQGKPAGAAGAASSSTKQAPDAKPSAPAASVPKSSSAASTFAAQPRPDPNTRRPHRDADALTKVQQAIAATAALKRQLKEQLNKELRRGEEAKTVHDVVAAAKSYRELAPDGTNPELVRKENANLRGQVAFLKNRLDARGGRDYPPCWADETGKVEFLFAVEVKPDQVVVSPAWPPRREAAGRALPGMAEVLGGSHSNQDFVSRIQGIFNWSKSQDPECRHYVQLKSSISDAVQSDRARLMVENYFYKTEARR